jgi:hypothetical protein
MNIFKLVILSLLWLTFLGVLKAALFVYVVFRPDSRLVAIAPESEGRTGDTNSNSTQEAGVTPTRSGGAMCL